MARPQLWPPVIMKLSPTPSSARPSSRMVAESVRVGNEAQRREVDEPAHSRDQKADDDGALRAARIRVAAGPYARENGGGKLRTRDKADNERAQSESFGAHEAAAPASPFRSRGTRRTLRP